LGLGILQSKKLSILFQYQVITLMFSRLKRDA